jgi:hypothetical protein
MSGGTRSRPAWPEGDHPACTTERRKDGDTGRARPKGRLGLDGWGAQTPLTFLSSREGLKPNGQNRRVWFTKARPTERTRQTATERPKFSFRDGTHHSSIELKGSILIQPSRLQPTKKVAAMIWRSDEETLEWFEPLYMLRKSMLQYGPALSSNSQAKVKYRA